MVQTGQAKVRLQTKKNVQTTGQFLGVKRNGKNILLYKGKIGLTLDGNHKIPKTNIDCLGAEKQPICTLVNLRIPSLDRV
jgi:hypothetical protein